MNLKCGIVGLPNIGKSTLFNALTSSHQAESKNYPFCTIEPNFGTVSVPDNRLSIIGTLTGSKNLISGKIEFIDIAGLIKGASQGEGLGNKFLSHIRQVDAIIYVLRCFQNTEIMHVNGTIDPKRDLETLETELMLADIQSLTKQLDKIKKFPQRNTLDTEAITLAEKSLQVLDEGNSINTIINESNKKNINIFNLLTSKPCLYVCNVDENSIHTGNKYTQKILDYGKRKNVECITVSAKIEEEIANLPSKKEKKEFLKELKLKDSGLNQLISASYKTLNLATYFTAGPKETRAWTIKNGWNAQKASGVIHSDFEKGFICCEVVGYEDYIKYKSIHALKAVGKVRQEGKHYPVKDGDIISFKFNVNKNSKFKD